MTTDYHMHSTFCDGKNSLEEMTLAYINKEFSSIGFSGHFPLPVDNEWTMTEADIEPYMEMVHTLAQKHKEQIEIYLGFEIDYLPWEQDISRRAKEIIPRLDYFIGSVHIMARPGMEKMADIDGTPEHFANGIETIYGGSIQDFVKDYYNNVATMAEVIQPTIVGHLNLIKKNNQNNRFFDEDAPWYKDIIEDCLDRIAQTDCIVEINTGGLARYGSGMLYPSPWMIERLYAKKIPITLNADTHAVDTVAYEFDKVATMLQKIGFKHVMVMKNGLWQESAIGN